MFEDGLSEQQYFMAGVIFTLFVIIAVLLLLVSARILYLCFHWFRKRVRCNHDQTTPTGTNKVNVPIITQVNENFKTYIDPYTYDDPCKAVQEFAMEIDPSCIIVEQRIGGGEFGNVFRGKLNLAQKGNGESLEIDVAIKTLKRKRSERDRKNFLMEASIMGQFDHPNVIYLHGVVTESDPVMIVMEYMLNGSLDTYLQRNCEMLELMQLVGMLRNIATGMQYLAEMNFVHRDLAARNVFVNADGVCKIADFGMSSKIRIKTQVIIKGNKIPIRWTAPEAFTSRKYSSASDVWSFGIVCWEVMSYGERPYWDWSNQDVMESVKNGYRLPVTTECPKAIHQLMTYCWLTEPMLRPSFSSIVSILDKLIKCPDKLDEKAEDRKITPFGPDSSDFLNLKSIQDWIRNVD